MQFGSEHNLKAVSSLNDPFNYPALKRTDLMNLSVMNKFDGVRTHTAAFRTRRTDSLNLSVNDIFGKYPF